MADDAKVKQPSLPANYVSIAVLRERWLQRQNVKKHEEGCVDGEKNGGNGGVDDGVNGNENRRNVNCDVDGMKINVGDNDGGGLGGYGDRRRFRRGSGDRRRFRRGSGRDSCKFGNVSGVGKGKNVVDKGNLVDVREESELVDVMEENVVDGKMLEVSMGYGYRRIDEIGRKFGDLKINGVGRKGHFRYGGECRRFGPRKEKIRVFVRKENEDEKPIYVVVRKQSQVEKPIAVAVSKENEVEKPIAVAERRENEVEKRNLVDVKGKTHVVKQIPDENQVEKQNMVDIKMWETSKGFGHSRRNEASGGKFGGLSDNGWRKGNVKYGRDRGRFGSWKNKHTESRMMWVKKCDAGAHTKALVETADVKWEDTK